ncbi:MAG: methyl-accepting chemotaxis protein, partial [Spirochaetia bacterium]|nr:methyl-accepting chemotaxis protein [Spirochaetia bacterium]
MKSLLKNSLRNKLLFSLFLICFVPTALVGLLNFEYSRLEERTNIFSELNEINRSKSLQITEHLTDQIYRAQALAEFSEVESFITAVSELPQGLSAEETIAQTRQIAERSRRDLERILGSSGFNAMVLLSATNGTVLFGSADAPIKTGERISALGTDHMLYETWSSVKGREQTILHDAVLSENSGLSLAVGVPVYDRMGLFSQILVLSLPMEQIELITAIEFGRYASRESYLIDSDSRVLTSPRFPAGAKRIGSIYDADYMSGALAEETSIEVIDSTEDGKPVILAAQEIDLSVIKGAEAAFTWHIITQMDRAEMSAPAVARAGFTILFLITVVLIVLVIGFFLIRRAIEPLMHLTGEVNRLSEGYLDIHLPTDRTDEIGMLLKHTDFMVERITEVVKAIEETIAQTNSIGSTIAASVQQQSSIAVEQAGSITEISSTMDEFTSSFAQVSENVKSVSQMSENIYTYITESSQLIESMADKIRDINVDNDRDIANIMELKQRSKDVAKVMEIINGISDQTKIIAFNAALEASSAGEAGKRFGVVAAEIRKLTESVIDSTSQIDKIISEIQNLADQMVLASEKTTKNIQKGLEYSSSSVENIEFMVESIRTTKEASQQITLSVQQQQTAAGQIQTGLQELST